jgi:cyclopropane-fatty-acyl-phospholipid synthase
MDLSNIHGGRAASEPRRLDRFARNAVVRALGRLPRGHLVITEPDGGRTELGRGEPSAALTVTDPRAWRLMMTGGALGAAEGYIAGYWESRDLVAVIRFFAANVEPMQERDRTGLRWLARPARAFLQWLRRNSRTGAKRNIEAHYDLGNDFFALFLDREMMYSSAVYPDADTDLDEAQIHKLRLICEQLELSPDVHLLEIGTGWGALAIHAARHYGCRVTTATISPEQYRYACERVRAAGLDDRVTVLECDYRELTGRYDRIVSVEMIEAVGPQYLPAYFRKLNELLRPDGLLLLQAITLPDQRYKAALRNLDFIKRYVFPGGFLPSVRVMVEEMSRQTRLTPVSLQDIGLDYARTLAHWRERFEVAREQVREQGFDRRFRRLWWYYLCYCEGAFRERAISTVQLLAAGPERGAS